MDTEGLNNLYKYTQLQSSFGVNNVALVKGRPQTLNLKDLISFLTISFCSGLVEEYSAIFVFSTFFKNHGAIIELFTQLVVS